MKIFYTVLIITMIFAINSGCGDSPVSDKQPKYYTADENHRWSNIVDDHMPEIEFINDDKTRIKVEVPLKPTQNPRHYIQVIALMEGEKEIASKKFNFSYNQAKAEFDLPDAEKSYWILVKCNKHDMWKAEVK